MVDRLRAPLSIVLVLISQSLDSRKQIFSTTMDHASFVLSLFYGVLDIILWERGMSIEYAMYVVRRQAMMM